MQLKNRIFLKKVRHYLVNKYTFVLLIFFVYLTFFDDHNLIKRYKTTQEINKLEKEYQYYLGEIEANKNKIYKLNHDTVFLEKFAREKYYMKNDDEDVFILK
ncbi:MAG: septum formation initiator family protein [Paludibacter sp.]|nr:septum formation initiator family protein [Paludibacter sp.]MDD4199185.1 septum formation initiator family protein [Paludibacter sp.]MDD4428618.1 septum formation initiator family protein [Paludibacter sp.]